MNEPEDKPDLDAVIRDAIKTGKPLIVRMAEADDSLYIRIYDTTEHATENGVAYSRSTVLVNYETNSRFVNGIINLIAKAQAKLEAEGE